MTDNLTGVWDGTFVQPQVGMVTFLATLIESGGALGGNVTEPCTVPGCPSSIHNASIAGHRSGSAVSFVKRYEPPGYAMTRSSMKAWSMLRRRKSMGTGGCQALGYLEHF